MAKSIEISLNDDVNVPLDKSNAVEFVRDIEVESRQISLQFSQYSIGDEGCVVWDAGIVLAKYFDYLQSSGSDLSLSGKMVFDIGSGTGIVGLFAAALGANVMLTDLPAVIPLLQKNIEANKSVLSGTASSSVYLWGDKLEEPYEIDIITVSDCIYYDMSVSKLIPTLIDLSLPKTIILISYEDRGFDDKKELLRSFLEELRKSFDISIIHSKEQHPDYQSPDIHLLRCQKKCLMQ